MEEKQFPILWDERDDLEKYGCPISVPWEFVAPHEKQAQSNHDQSLARIAQRGGLDPSELVAVLEGRNWRGMALSEAVASPHRHLKEWKSKRVIEMFEQSRNVLCADALRQIANDERRLTKKWSVVSITLKDDEGRMIEKEIFNGVGPDGFIYATTMSLDETGRFTISESRKPSDGQGYQGKGVATVNALSNLWWLSFCDPDLPLGQQFLGACIIQGDDMIGAIKNAHVNKCNPGGEVRGHQIPAGIAPRIPAHLIAVVLTKQIAENITEELLPLPGS